MSRSFSIDLNQFSLMRHIGLEEKPLERPLGASDVVRVLERLGYHRLEEPFSGLQTGFGTVPFLEDLITSKVIGIPASALVTIARIAGKAHLLLITFTY